MANIAGDDVKLSEIIRNSLNDVLSKELCSDKIDVTIEPGSKKGDNTVGIVYSVSGKLSENIPNGNSRSKLSTKVFLKVAPPVKGIRAEFFLRFCFLREIRMYDEVLPLFRRLQESNGIDAEKDGFHEYPQCYKTIDAVENEALVLQDLKADRFEMFDRFQVITIDHVRLVMKTLGKYHALSFALRDQQPEKFEGLSKMEEVFARPADANFKAYFNLLFNGAYKSLDQEGDERLLKKVKQVFSSDLFTVICECVNGASAEPYAVVCHGDCWNNNIMYKYDKNQKPVDLRLVDWQVSRYATPVADIVYYIFCCTTKPLRDQYYNDMIRTYHDSLSEMITRLGSDPAKLFPFDALQSQLRQFGKYGMVMATMLLPVITLEPEEYPDLDEMAESFQIDTDADSSPFKPNAAVFNKRMRDVIVDMDRLGYI